MEIPELKTRLTILEVAQHLGITVDRHGKALFVFAELPVSGTLRDNHSSHLAQVFRM